MLNKKTMRLMKKLKKIIYKKVIKKVYHHVITLPLVFQGFQVYQLTVMSVLYIRSLKSDQSNFFVALQRRIGNYVRYRLFKIQNEEWKQCSYSKLVGEAVKIQIYSGKLTEQSLLLSCTVVTQTSQGFCYLYAMV